MTQPQIEKQGKNYLHIVPRSSDMKFHKIWSKGCGEMASDGRMDVHIAKRLYAPPKFFGEHNKPQIWFTYICL